MRGTAGRCSILYAIVVVAMLAGPNGGCGVNSGADDTTDGLEWDALEMPVTDDPATELPAAELPRTDTLPSDLPPTDLPIGDLAADVPPVDIPGQDLPKDTPPVTPGVPILERTPDLRFNCSVTRTATDHAPRVWGRGAHPLVTTAGGTVFLARNEATPSSPFEPAPFALRISTFRVDGTIGSAIDVLQNTDLVGSLAAAPAGDGLLLAWSDDTIHTAIRNASGDAVAQPRALAGTTTDSLTRPVLAPLGSNFGMAFSAPGNGGGRPVRFARLDATAGLEGDVLNLGQFGSEGDEPAPAVAARADRWGILWQESGNSRGHVFFVAVDAAGTVVVPRKQVSSTDEDGAITTSGSFGTVRQALVATESGWIAAWTEVRTGVDFQSGASAIIRVARLDADGVPLDEAPVRVAVVDVDEVEPVLVPFQGAVGLFWSSGQHIYICGGCRPDHRVDFVLMDPVTLAPVSEVQSIPPTTGGLLGLSPTVAGDDLLLTFEIGFHVSQDPGSAALRCAARTMGTVPESL